MLHVPNSFNESFTYYSQYKTEPHLDTYKFTQGPYAFVRNETPFDTYETILI